MKVTVIGYWHGFPEKDEATSGYLLEHEQCKLLIDCGSGVLAKLQSYCKVEELDAVVLSHYHHDHKADLGPLQYASIIKAAEYPDKQLPIYGHRMDEEQFAGLTFQHVTTGVEYKEEEQAMIGPFTFQFLRTRHPVPCYAMKITVTDGASLVYTADTSYFDQLADFSAGADLLIAECSGYAGEKVTQFGHMTSSCVGKLAARAQPRQVLLSHLPHHGKHQQLIREVLDDYQGAVATAKTGWQYELAGE
ncbi:MBL fold metallo-hydrolase [Halalkalibacter oceani]|uniref:MBL fold metallo-hydrolase n=1 Tax=Halalkalibacter oceani TaxID=1653776 RepID=A0A9X2DTD0_9BACI|nr:MBL fold metallo-hydrolase [Halalkalibacter oceani]